jgi:aminopeptidase N
MSGEKPQAVHRLDYRAPDYWIERVDLHFDLGDEETLVKATLAVHREEALSGDAPPLVLDGEDLELRALAIDGRVLAASEYHVDEEALTIHTPPARFELETEVAIRPENNTQLSGLYASSGMYCTQCEAQGFRRITYFLDRPDVMASFSTTIEADRERYPVLLSNGNRTHEEALPDGRHRVRWEDPWKKPSYLFALVAGDLHCHEGSFSTRSGREVRLEIWVEHKNADRCEHALRSLQKSMKWDEDTFGLEYDLDVYMIVAVNDFNMGAMENKGLNVFNSKYVLARPDTATDAEYEAIEAVIAHEYFHNWTGNRVTCRDWFQLTLKEGLTVFRDQQFTADATSHATKRIEDVRLLRARQFLEDSGPMSHPIRPESYISMDNFYTATVYEKGAEVVRLYHTLLGGDGFRRGMDLYFERHDGQAVTCDDFRAAMADANAQNLGAFERWYAQSGTPVLEAEGRYDPELATYALTLRQSMGEGEEVAPLPIPVALGLIGTTGDDLPLRLAGEAEPASETTRVLMADAAEQRFLFVDVEERPVPSVLRGFSAPVRLRMKRDRAELAFLMAHDRDSFNRWDAGQQLAQEVLLESVSQLLGGKGPGLDPLFVEAFGRVLEDASLDGSLKSLALSLPGETVLGQEMDVVYVDEVHNAREHALVSLAEEHRAAFEAVFERCDTGAPYSVDADSIHRRRLGNTALRYLATLGDPTWTALIYERFRTADNMTEREAALQMLVDLPGAERDAALSAFYDDWKDDALVLDKWFTAQAISRAPDTVDRVIELSKHRDFDLGNPNRIRALIGAFASGNPVAFHQVDGRGYDFLADIVLELQARNPQVASRLVSLFNPWRRYDPGRQARMKGQLERIAGEKSLSKDVYEIVTRALA